MKRLYLSLLVIGNIIILLLGGCNSAPENSFEINGTITNNPDNLSKVYLEYTINDSTILDSAVIAPNGTFAFSETLPSEEPIRALLAQDRENRWWDRTSYFFIEPGKINILLNISEMRTSYNPARTDLEKEYNEWSAVYMKNARIAGKLWNKVDANETTDAERVLLRKEIDSLRDCNSTFDLNFIKKYPKSYVSLYELIYVWYEGDKEKALVDSIFMQMPASLRRAGG